MRPTRGVCRVGLEQNRLAMLLAVLHRHAGIACFDQDVFINAVGGVKITEPGADLAVLAGDRVQPAQQAAAGKAGGVRRSRPGRRNPPGAARPGTPARKPPSSASPRPSSAANAPKQKIAGMRSCGAAAGRSDRTVQGLLSAGLVFSEEIQCLSVCYRKRPEMIPGVVCSSGSEPGWPATGGQVSVLVHYWTEASVRPARRRRLVRVRRTLHCRTGRGRDRAKCTARAYHLRAWTVSAGTPSPCS